MFESNFPCDRAPFWADSYFVSHGHVSFFLNEAKLP